MVCEAKTSGSLEFCRNCFHEFKDDIQEKKPWVRTLKNESQRERRRREKEYDNTSLDAILDRSWAQNRWE